MHIHVPTVEYFGYRVDLQGLQPMPDKVVAITGAPRPKLVQEILDFLGLANYYRKFMEKFSTISCILGGDPLVLRKAG